MYAVNHLTEFDRHQWLREHLLRSPLDPIGVGEDCAVLELSAKDYLLVSSDRVPLSAYGRSYSYIGKLCVIQNLSDVICKGGRPLGVLINTFTPRRMPTEAWRELMTAAQECCIQHETFVIGGDTKEAPTLSVVGCAVGLVEKERLLLRSTARPGDICAITLTKCTKIGLPWAYQVLSSLQMPRTDSYFRWLETQLVTNNLQFPYREMLAANSGPGINAAIDTSDGIGGALHLLTKGSEVGVELCCEALASILDPEITRIASEIEVDPIAFAFSPGFVWEGLLSVTPDMFSAVAARVAGSGGQLVRLGRFTKHKRVIMGAAGARREEFPLFFNEGFRPDRDTPNSVTAWLTQYRGSFYSMRMGCKRSKARA